MANSALFAGNRGELPPAATTTNLAGGKAYAMSPRHALTQYALTGTFNDTFYASASVQLEDMLKLCEDVPNDYIAKLAIYARKEGLMKDTSAFLLAYLSTTDYPHLAQVFDKVINNGKMLRNYVQMIRSGVLGRKSLGSKLRRLVQVWLLKATDRQILEGNIGNDPSLADVIKMVHPKPIDPNRAALFAWIIGKPFDKEHLPKVCADYDAFVATPEEERATLTLPEVPFLMLSSLQLAQPQWRELVLKMSWTQLRMNLNTLQRNDVFADTEITAFVAGRLKDKEAVLHAKAFPYQILTTYSAVKGTVPNAISDALHDAMEYSLINVPTIEGPIAVLCDTSASMGSEVIGKKIGNVSSKTTCVDVAALISVAILRKNPNTVLLGFDTQVHDYREIIDARDTVITNAKKLAAQRGGGTDCAAPLRALTMVHQMHNVSFDTVVMVSDNESWITEREVQYQGRSTPAHQAWSTYKSINPNAKLICIDINPNKTTQLAERPGVTNVGGFSDSVFKLLGQIVAGGTGADHWVNEVEKSVVIS